MATFTYNHAVKINGKIVPANTPFEVTDKSTEQMDSTAGETNSTSEQTEEVPSKRRTTKKKA